MSATTTQPSVLSTRRGQLTLVLLCAVAFLDFVDAPILNVALPSIRHDLHFSLQGLQWVPKSAVMRSSQLPRILPQRRLLTLLPHS